MSKLDYSKEAINVLARFYKSDAVVFVEGEDDEDFWRIIFQKCAAANVAVRSVGGAAALDEQIARIVSEDLAVLSARDADYLTCSGRAVSDPRVVYTYGYSIENSLFVTQCVSELTEAWCKGRVKDAAEICQEWQASLYEALTELVTLDAINDVADTGISVLGDNIMRFCKRNKLCRNTVGQQSENVRAQFSEEQLAAAAARLDPDVDASRWLRGHFVASACLHFIAEQMKLVGLRSRISYDALYASASQFLKSNFGIQHPHYRHYLVGTQGAMAALDRG